jgi:hypothetical protein
MEPNNKMTRQPEIVGRAMVPVEREDFVPAEAQVRVLAHEIYRVRCDRGEQGDELADWIAAESELKRSGEDGAPTIRITTRAGESQAALVRSDNREPAA